MLNGLREVHSNKLLHLDLKPSNIYLRADNTPVLIDFGAARQTLITDQPVLKPMYTPGFASPEHYGSRKDLGPWSDIYSVGASMYACLAGSAPQAADARLKKTPCHRPCCAGMASFQTACSKSSTGASTSTIFTVRKASLPCKGARRDHYAAAAEKQSELDRSLCRENQKADVMRFTIYQESRQGGRANNEDRTTYCYSRDAC
jgi:serine/threonine protein kinase